MDYRKIAEEIYEKVEKRTILFPQHIAPPDFVWCWQTMKNVM